MNYTYNIVLFITWGPKLDASLDSLRHACDPKI